MALLQELLPVSDGDVIDIDTQFPAVGSHWQKVDDWNIATYVYSSVAPYHRDLYNFQSFTLPAGHYIVGLEVHVRCSYNGVYQYRALIKTHGIEYLGPEKSGNAAGWGTVYQCLNDNPFTGQPWTEGEVSDIQAGVALIGPGPALVNCFGVKIRVYYRLILSSASNWHVVDESLGMNGYSISPNVWTDEAPEQLIVRAPSGRYFCVYGVYGDYTGVYPNFWLGDDCRSLRLAWSDNLRDWNYAWVPFTQIRHWYASVGIAVDNNSNVYVIGREYELMEFLGDPDALVLSKFSPEGVLLSQDVFETGVNGLPNVIFKVDEDDNIHLAWFNYTGRGGGDTNKLYYRRRNADGTWEAREELDSQVGPWAPIYPSLDVDVNGIPHIVYYRDKHLDPGYWCYRYIHIWKPTPVAAWSFEVLYEHPVEEATTWGYVVLRASPDGKLHTSYCVGVPFSRTFYYREHDGVAWGLPILIDDPADPLWTDNWENQPFVDRDSNVYAACTTWDDFVPIVPKANGSWGPTTRIGLPAGEDESAISVMNSIFPLGSNPSLPGSGLSDKVILINSQADWPWQILLWGPAPGVGSAPNLLPILS